MDSDTRKVRETARRFAEPGPGPEAARSRFVLLRLDSARRVFGSDAAIARALEVDAAQVARWRRGQRPDGVNGDRLAALDVVVEMLDGWFSPGRSLKWLEGGNANLGDRSPLAALRSGDLPAVVAAVMVLKSGSHA
jgi:hypothetical protein